MDLPPTEQDESQRCSTQEDCPGCVERDVEIARLVALNQKSRSFPWGGAIALAGWLAVVCMPILLISLIMNSSQPGSIWVKLFSSLGALISLIVFSFAFAPIVLIVDWRPRFQKVFACCLSTIGIFGVWYIARAALPDFEGVIGEVWKYSPVLPIGVLFAATPMMVMKLWRRWKLTSREVGRVGNDPSISTILIITAIVAACVASLQFFEHDAFEHETIWAKTWMLIDALATPSLMVGVFIVAGFYFVLAKTRWVKSVLVLSGCMLAGTTAPPLVMLLQTFAIPEDASLMGISWLDLLRSSFGSSLVCLLLGLLLAGYLRLLGYRLITQNDRSHRSSVPE